LQENLNGFINTPYGFAVYFVMLWCFVCIVLSVMSGWFALSRRFHKQSDPYGETRSAGPFSYGIRMRFRIGYGNVIRLTAAEDALYLSILLLFRIGHPPLRIPWQDVQFGRSKFLWQQYVVLTLGKQERIPMRISERMARKLGILEQIPEASSLTESSTPIR